MSAERKNTPEQPGSGGPKVSPAAVPVPAYTQTSFIYSDGSAVSLADVWRILGRYRRLVFGLTLLGTVLATAAAFLMTPEYRADVLLAPVSDLEDSRHASLPLEQLGGMAALAGINLEDHRDKKNEAIATLQSRRFSEQFIAAHKLAPILFADLWDEKRGDWKSQAPGDVPRDWKVFKEFDKNVREVRENSKTGLVTLSIQWKDPGQAAQWANDLVADVNATLREQAVAESNRAITYLREQLKRTSVVELQQVLHRLIESEMKKIMLANINREYAFKVIDPAVPPGEPVRPRKAMMIALGTAAGLVLGAMIALLREALRTGEEGSSRREGGRGAGAAG